MVVFFLYFLMLLWITNDRFSCSLTIDNASESELRTSSRESPFIIVHSFASCCLFFPVYGCTISCKKMCNEPSSYSQRVSRLCVYWRKSPKISCSTADCDAMIQHIFSFFFPLFSSTRYKNWTLCNVFAAAVSLCKLHERKLFLKIFNFFFPPHVFLVGLLLPLLSMPTHNNLFSALPGLLALLRLSNTQSECVESAEKSAIWQLTVAHDGGRGWPWKFTQASERDIVSMSSNKMRREEVNQHWEIAHT